MQMSFFWRAQYHTTADILMYWPQVLLKLSTNHSSALVPHLWRKGKAGHPACRSSPSRTSGCSLTRPWEEDKVLIWTTTKLPTTTKFWYWQHVCHHVDLHSLDPVELGAVGQVRLVGDHKCKREEGGDRGWLFCPFFAKLLSGFSIFILFFFQI